MARIAPKFQKISPVLAKTIDLTIAGLMGNSTYTHDKIETIVTHCIAATEALLYGKVKNARIVVYDRTPMVRLSIKYDKTMWTISQTNPLVGMIDTLHIIKGGSWPTAIAKEILPLLPLDQMAIQMSDIMNASAAVLLDPKKTGKVRDHMKKIRATDKERLMATIRRVFSGHDNMISEDEVIQMWRETLVSGVHDS